MIRSYLSQMVAVVSGVLIWGAVIASPILDLGSTHDELPLFIPKITLNASVEVVEFFSYACGHCANLEPAFTRFGKKWAPQNVAVIKVPAVFNDTFEFYARVYYALESENLLDKTHVALFSAIHADKVISGPDSLKKWLKSRGVNSERLFKLMASEPITSKIKLAIQYQNQYRPAYVPIAYVNGKYSTSPSQTGGAPEFFEVLQELVKQEMPSKPRHIPKVRKITKPDAHS